MSPYKKLYNKLLDHFHPKVFGCLWYATNLSIQRKFTERSFRCAFIGYPFNSKGYRVLDLDTKKVFIGRDVIFVEHVFPFHTIPHSSEPTTLFSPQPDDLVHEITTSLDEFEGELYTTDAAHFSTYALPTPIVLLKRSTRQRKIPDKYQDYVVLPYSSYYHRFFIIYHSLLASLCNVVLVFLVSEMGTSASLGHFDDSSSADRILSCCSSSCWILYYSVLIGLIRESSAYKSHNLIVLGCFFFCSAGKMSSQVVLEHQGTLEKMICHYIIFIMLIWHH